MISTWPMWHVFIREADILLIEPVGMVGVLRHEMGHCWGLAHPAGGRDDEWVVDKPASAPTSSLPKRHEATNTARPPRNFSGDGY